MTLLICNRHGSVLRRLLLRYARGSHKRFAVRSCSCSPMQSPVTRLARAVSRRSDGFSLPVYVQKEERSGGVDNYECSAAFLVVANNESTCPAAHQTEIAEFLRPSLESPAGPRSDHISEPLPVLKRKQCLIPRPQHLPSEMGENHAGTGSHIPPAQLLDPRIFPGQSRFDEVSAKRTRQVPCPLHDFRHSGVED
jgi:hypothetical protein